jgi:hypothetical protein
MKLTDLIGKFVKINVSRNNKTIAQTRGVLQKEDGIFFVDVLGDADGTTYWGTVYIEEGVGTLEFFTARDTGIPIVHLHLN